MIRNPKQEGTCLYDCRPQVGPCPHDCNQCFYNRPGAFYVPIDQPQIPDPAEVGDGIVRMNCGNDSNNQRELVLETARQYRHAFYNTSVPRLDFPGPVVFTANALEELPAYVLPAKQDPPANLMFVRLRVSTTNLYHVISAVHCWTSMGVPVVLTFMAYYDQEPPMAGWAERCVGPLEECYVWKVRHINSYWCATPKFQRWVLSLFQRNRLVTMCGTPDSGYCLTCRSCETYYWQTIHRLALKGELA